MNKILLRKVFFPAYHRIKNTKLNERIDEVNKNQWFSKQELNRLQEKKLKNLLYFSFENVPYYKKKFMEVGIDLKDLHRSENFCKIPLLTKNEINKNRQLLISKRINQNTLLPNSTSGSTGEALYFYYDIRSWTHRRAVNIRTQEALGIKIGDRSARLWGAPIDIKKAEALRGRLHSWINNKMILSSYDLSDQNLQNYYKKLYKFKPELLISYPGPLTVFAENMINNKNILTSIRAIISSAETLFEWQRELIERAFSCPVYNRYGCREFGDIAHECERREGLHVNSDRVYLEILDDNLETVADGQTGEIVITDLDNYAMPLIRYRIGDVASFKNEKCSCGRSLPLLKKIDGRTLDIVKAPNGNRLGGTFWTILFKSHPGIKAFRIIQERLDSLIVEYVEDPTIKNINLEYYRKKIKKKCGNNFSINFRNVSKIPTTISGKTRIVISRLQY